MNSLFGFDPYQQMVNQNVQPQVPQLDRQQVDSMLSPLVQQGKQQVAPLPMPRPQMQQPPGAAGFGQASPLPSPLPSPAQRPLPPQMLASVLDSFKSEAGKSIAQQLGIDTSKLSPPDSLPMPLNSAQRIGAATHVAMSGGTPYAIASSYLGLNEREGRKTLSGFFQKSGGMNLDPSNTPWCAAFANSVLKAGGMQGTGSAMARSFLNWGTPTDAPTQGDVVVMRRGKDPRFGHVGFYAGEGSKPGTIRILGGNQGDAVSIKEFPASSVLGYRQPPSAQELMPQRQQAPRMPVVNPEQFNAPRHNMMQTQASPMGGMVGSLLGSLFAA